MTARVAEQESTAARAADPRTSMSEPGTPGRSSCQAATLSFPGRPGGIAAAPNGAVFVSDLSSGSIWRLADGLAREIVSATPIAGATGTGRERLLTPKGLALASDGTLFVADPAGHRVCALSPTGRLRVVAGGTAGNRDGEGVEASFRFPADVAVGGDGTCYVADRGNHRIRTIAADGAVRTLAGSIYDYGDGKGSAARFRLPEGVSAGPDGSCYVADTGNNAVRRVSPDGDVETVAGAPPGGRTDGTGSAAGLRWPTALAAGRDGGLLVVDHGNHALRRIGRDGEVTDWLALSGRHFPVAVVVSGRHVVVAAMSLDDPLRPEACVFTERIEG